VAIVAGSGRGLGRSHAGHLAARGARVIVNDEAGADVAVDDIRKSGGDATASFDDISTPEDAASLVRGAVDSYGTIDIHVNNAAIGRFTTMSDITIEEYELVRQVGLDGTFYVTREV
jgi:NAD(P)-dependent dehydrogenase (short-subunit alcohol dehydrogenase family)